MSHDNHGSQSGNSSINVGVGDFRGAHVHVGGDGRPVFSPEDIQIKRHIVFGTRVAPREGINAFGIVASIAGLLGLYFTLFQAFPSTKYASWPTLFMFALAAGGMCQGAVQGFL